MGNNQSTHFSDTMYLKKRSKAKVVGPSRRQPRHRTGKRSQDQRIRDLKHHGLAHGKKELDERDYREITNQKASSEEFKYLWVLAHNSKVNEEV